MIRPLVILAIGIWGCGAGPAQSTNDEIRLRATVRRIVLLSDFSGTVIPVDRDPGLALTVRIESAIPPAHDFALGADVTFAIHSPSMLFVAFGGKAKKGETYDFSLRREIKDGKVRFLG